MNWSDYEAVWKRQEVPVGAAADPAKLLESFERKSRKLHAAIQVRDWAEGGAGIFVAGIYAFFWWKVGKAGWPLAFAIALILFVSGKFARERWRAKRTRIGADAPMLAKVDADIRELRHQAHLLRTLWAWYFAPITGAMAIQLGLIVHRSPSWDPIREPIVLLVFCGFLGLVTWFAWEINRRALRKRLQPRILELEKLRSEILSEP
jgi:hypothetical protein